MLLKPNVVFVVAHDLGRHLRCYGVPTVSSPNLDALAQGGVRFAQSFCIAPQCSPSRAALFTGRTPHQNGVMGLTHSHFAWDLHPGEKHLAGLLRDVGYDTALVGIQHETRRPQDMGWNTIIGRSAPSASGETRQTGASDLAQNAAHEIVRMAQNDAPFYLQVGFFEPHRAPGTPGDFGVMPPDDQNGVTVPPFLQNDEPARDEFRHYQGAIKSLDEAVGQIFAAVDALPANVRDNTLLVFTTDHGIPFPRAKCSLYEPGLQTCLLMRWANGGLTGGRVVDALIPHTDIFATLCDWCGITNAPLGEGKSFAPLLRFASGENDAGENDEGRDTLFAEMTFHEYCDPVRSVRTHRWKLIANFSSAPSFMNPSQQWQPRCSPVVPARPHMAYHPPVELYDLNADPWETTNLADEAEHALVRTELLQKLHHWMERTQDPLLHGIPASPIYRKTLAALQGETS